MTALGAITTAGGAVLFAQVAHANDGLPIFGIPIMTAGVGRCAGGIPLIVAGKRAPESTVAGGPGGFTIRV